MVWVLRSKILIVIREKNITGKENVIHSVNKDMETECKPEPMLANREVYCSVNVSSYQNDGCGLRHHWWQPIGVTYVLTMSHSCKKNPHKKHTVRGLAKQKYYGTISLQSERPKYVQWCLFCTLMLSPPQTGWR